LEHQILKLNGFSKPYCQIKWIFPSIMTPIKSLMLLESNSHAKMAPDTESELLRLGASLAAANEAKRQASRGFFANRRMVSRYEPCLHEPPTAAKSDCMLVSLIPTRF
jgi:hypothetical protein